MRAPTEEESLIILERERERMSLPRFIALESAPVAKFLYYLADDGDYHGALAANGETIQSPYAKFEVERAQSGGNRVNIRSCYSNKYLMLTTRGNAAMIGCDAKKPQEDASLRTCTLFEPVFTTSENRNFIRLRFAFDGRYATITSSNLNLYDYLGLNTYTDNRGLFTVSDWELLCILPKYVAFKGDNGLLLSARTIQDRPYLQFDSDQDIGDPTVANEVFPLHDGAILLKSSHFGRFWRRSPDWILADSDDTTATNLDTVFLPIRVSSNVIAVRNLGNNNFCARLNADGKTSCLNANSTTINKWARLEVFETVLSRDISNVQFRVKDARIYDKNVLVVTDGHASNTTAEPNSVTIKFNYSVTESKSFTCSVGLKLGVETNIRAGIPIIADGQIKINVEFEGKLEWGSKSETKKEIETTYTVTVPPRTALNVSLVATQGKCDVPFSYTQRDTLMNGQTATTIMNDGVYTGANYFNFHYDTNVRRLDTFDEPLPLSSRSGLLAA